MAALFSKHVSSRKISTFLVVGLSLSVGWGIRGNFGHEYGAAIAGSLAAIAVALLSAREDWRNKIHYFALFGAIGWGFGASISYMRVLGFTESGHFASQWYGYACVFIIGFLWAGLGGVGTALPAVMEKDRIVKFFTPLLFVFGARLLLGIIEDPVARALQSGIAFDRTASRHENPLYWFDAYYLPAFSALFGAGVYDIWQRKGDRNRLLLPQFAIGGAIVGFLFQFFLRKAGIEDSFASVFTYEQGDLSFINPETGLPAYKAEDLLNNWPQFFSDYPQHIGWLIGCIAGITVYFFRFGKFRNDASLFIYMAGGWLIGFFALPVLGGNLFASYGGIRMTPPRSDDWAGILGLFIGTIIWLWRNNLRPVAWAAIVCGTVGGVGFTGMQWLKTTLMSFGNADILTWKGIVSGSEEFVAITTRWAKWRAQNWHSFLEQSYGFANGIAIATAMALLSTRVKMEDTRHYTGENRRYGRWTRVVSTLVILLGLTYVNLIKAVDDWAGQDASVWKQEIVQPDGSKVTVPAQWDLPVIGRLPGMDFLHLTPENWVTLTWGLLVIACLLIVRKHLKSPVAVIPSSATGKAQLIFLILIWIMNIANFQKALVGWHPMRLLTEWTIFVNTIILTWLILVLPVENEHLIISSTVNYKKSMRKNLFILFTCLLLSATVFTITNRWIYQYPPYEEMKKDKKNRHIRFGPDADWRTKPNLKNMPHH